MEQAVEKWESDMRFIVEDERKWCEKEVKNLKQMRQRFMNTYIHEGGEWRLEAIKTIDIIINNLK